MSSGRPVTVFISYSHADAHWLEQIEKHLKLLEDTGAIRCWTDAHIHAGDDWNQEVESAVSEARVAILLVSVDFLTSKYIQEKELPRLLQAYGDGHLHLLPIFVRPCTVPEPLAGIQAAKPNTPTGQ